MLLVFGLDASNRILSGAYDEIITEWVVEDPQVVPSEVLRPTIAVAAERILEAEIWSWLVAPSATVGAAAAGVTHGRSPRTGRTGRRSPLAGRWAPRQGRGLGRRLALSGEASNSGKAVARWRRRLEQRRAGAHQGSDRNR